jgi:hypothetical protein
MKIRSYSRVLYAACVTTLLATALMVWSLLEPTPMPVLVAMSAGQVLGTISLVSFLAVVAVDLRRVHLERELRSSYPPSPTSER